VSAALPRQRIFQGVVGDPNSENIDTRNNRLGVPRLAAPTARPSTSRFPSKKRALPHGHAENREADPDKALSLKVDALRALSAQTGDIFSTEKVRKALENYGKIYRRVRIIDFTPEPDTEIDEANK